MILMIHGAGSTGTIFNYLSLWLDQELQYLEYQVGDSHDEIFDRIDRPDEVQYIVGHSYGGLLGAEWLSKDVRNVKGMIAIASPWQGSPTARILNWFLSDPVWNDMKPGSELLKKINSINLTIPVKNVIANPHQGGNGLAGTGKSENDGTIPIDSARNYPAGFSRLKSVELPYGHGEILQSFELVELIRLFCEDPAKDTQLEQVEYLTKVSTMNEI